MPGLIEQIVSLGLERKELAKDFPKAEIGGQRIPYPPQDLAAVVTQLIPRAPQSYLAIEVSSDAGWRFIAQRARIPSVVEVGEANKDEKSLRKWLRLAKDPVDLVSIDGRGLALPVDEIWKYIEGQGRAPYPSEFGKGVPADYGEPRLKPLACLVFNLADEATRQLWYRMRNRYVPMYQTNLTGMCHV